MKRLGGSLAALALPLVLAFVAWSLFSHAIYAAADHAMGAEYGRLKNGMRREEADKVMRSTGMETSSTETGGHVMRLVEWDGPNGAAVTAIFRDESLIAKSREPSSVNASRNASKNSGKSP